MLGSYSETHGCLSLSGSSECEPFQHPLQAANTTTIGEVGDEKTPPPFGVEKEMVDFHQVVQQELAEFPIAKIAENSYDYLKLFGEIFI